MIDDDKTAEEDAIDISEDGEETEATEVHSTTTDFSKITFFVDRTSQQDVITEEHLALNSMNEQIHSTPSTTPTKIRPRNRSFLLSQGEGDVSRELMCRHPKSSRSESHG